MKRYILCLGILISTLFSARAQYVSIPDSSFGDWLYTHGYDTCMTGSSTAGWQLDTACSALPQAVDLDCSGDSIKNISGIRYFKHLRNLYCERNVLTSLPALPASLTYINCGFNPISTIASLPDSLVTLECAYDQLSTLPALPATITQINCSYNQIGVLPTLPASLQGLICSTNQLTALPALPAGLLSIDCSYNQLGAIPALPSGLFNLLCQGNALSSLPVLDDSLRFLTCSYNLLTSLPAMPPLLISLDCSSNHLTGISTLDAHLVTFYCQNNLLTALPALPDTIVGLNCSYNQLSSLPNLPFNLLDLNCTNNPSLACLPVIYQNPLNSFYIDSTAIQCLPDAFSALTFDMDPDSIALCTAASGCPYTTTGIQRLSDYTFSLYPNPNHGSFTLQTSGSIGSTYTITDMLGNVIDQKVISTDTQTIDLTDAAAGVYMLRLRGAAPVRFVVVR